MIGFVTSDGSLISIQPEDLPQTPEFILSKMRSTKDTQSQELVRLFAELESMDVDIATNAKENLDFLLNQGFPLSHLFFRSLPLWPPNTAALLEIVLRQSASNNPILRERAIHACSHLITSYNCKEGYAVAKLLAEKKLGNPDETIQQEGLSYYKLLLNQNQPELPLHTLMMAIHAASKMFLRATNFAAEANCFFRDLIKYGKENDVLKMEQFLLDACVSDQFDRAFDLCMLATHPSQKRLLAILLKAASKGYASENKEIRRKAFFLSHELLAKAPEDSMDIIIQAILTESKRKEPCTNIILILRALVFYESSDPHLLGGPFRETVKKRWSHDSILLLEALTNLSSCNESYIKNSAVKMKEKLEEKRRRDAVLNNL